jgi:hypothetical protein
MISDSTAQSIHTTDFTKVCLPTGKSDKEHLVHRLFELDDRSRRVMRSNTLRLPSAPHGDSQCFFGITIFDVSIKACYPHRHGSGGYHG